MLTFLLEQLNFQDQLTAVESLSTVQESFANEKIRIFQNKA